MNKVVKGTVITPVVQLPAVDPPAVDPPAVDPASKLKRIWDNYQVIGEVLKSDKIKLVVAAAVRDGVRYLNIREFYFRKRNGDWRPGRDGITIPLVYPINEGKERLHSLARFEELLQKAGSIAETIELYSEVNAIYIEKKEKMHENKRA